MRLIAFCFLLTGSSSLAQVFVPTEGNSWSIPQDVPAFKTYVWLGPGTLQVSLAADIKTQYGAKVMIQSESKHVLLPAGKGIYNAGTWTIASEGYIPIEVVSVSESDITGLQLSGTAVNERTAFVLNNEDNFYYWGRRGPSVHLRFDLGDRSDVEWFYSEITVPEKNDVVGSYYMANGFADGYFGFQVNSPKERRILFSVWSPFKTDDPKSIPPEDRIILVKKGYGVYTGEFGNEGSGGQSYWRYPWKAGTTYGFLLRGQPDSVNTIYTAWFFAPEKGRWSLIASWRRPKKAAYLSSLYSFLENFEPLHGDIERRALYGNQWICDKAGNWTELTTIKFTGDNTARKNYRKDYGGGVFDSAFFLRNCGFFSDFTPLDQTFTRPSMKKPPVIDLAKLP